MSVVHSFHRRSGRDFRIRAFRATETGYNWTRVSSPTKTLRHLRRGPGHKECLTHVLTLDEDGRQRGGRERETRDEEQP